MGREPKRLDDAFRTIRLLNDEYHWDRVFTIAAAIVAFLICAAITVYLLVMDKGTGLVIGAAGSSGILTLANFRIAFFYKSGLKLVTQALIKDWNAQP